MNCEQVERLLPRLAVGELDDAQQAQVEEHLATCPACRQSLADLRMAYGVLRQAVNAGPPPVLSDARHAELFAKARAEEQRPTSPLVKSFRFAAVRPFLPLAAAAVLLLVLAGMLLPALSRAREEGRRAYGRADRDLSGGYDGYRPAAESTPSKATAPPAAGGELDFVDGHASGRLTDSYAESLVKSSAGERDNGVLAPSASPDGRGVLAKVDRGRISEERPAAERGEEGGRGGKPRGKILNGDRETEHRESKQAPAETPALPPPADAGGPVARPIDSAVARSGRVVASGEESGTTSPAGGVGATDAPAGLGYLLDDGKRGETSYFDRNKGKLEEKKPETGWQMSVGGAGPAEKAALAAGERRAEDDHAALRAAGRKVAEAEKESLRRLSVVTGPVRDDRYARDQVGEKKDQSAAEQNAPASPATVAGRVVEGLSRLETDKITSKEQGASAGEAEHRRLAAQTEDEITAARKRELMELKKNGLGVSEEIRYSAKNLWKEIDRRGAQLIPEAAEEQKAAVVIGRVAQPSPTPAKPEAPEPTKTDTLITPTGETAAPAEALPVFAAPSETLPVFRAVPVNPWVMTRQDALSTFAIDVDTASYAIARRYIHDGCLPPAASVRMEEFVNSFDYNYPRQGERVFTVCAEAAPSPFRRGLTLLKVGVRGKVVGREGLRPANLVFVVDASGSMARADRMPLVRHAIDTLTRQLGERDRVSVVTFSTSANVLADNVRSARPEEQRAVADTLARVQCGGSTNLFAGLQVGYRQAAAHFITNGVNRVVLCSDGVANVGPDQAETLLRQVKIFRDQGVTFTAAGFGAGAYNDDLLERLADQGDGNYVYIDSAAQAERVFAEEMAATLHTIAKDAKIQVEFNPASVRRYRLIGFENRDIADKDFRNDAIDAGEVGSGQSSTALYEVELFDVIEDRVAPDLGTVYVRYRNVETGAVEEISQRLSAGIKQTRTVEDAPRFYLAACAATFAEVLRGSEHAKGVGLEAVRRLTARVARQLPLDARVQELNVLVTKARGLPRAEAK